MEFKDGQLVDKLDDGTKKTLELCRWHGEHDLSDPSQVQDSYTGYVKNGCVYDNCRFEYLKTLAKWDADYATKWKKFIKFKETMNTSIETLKDLLAHFKLRNSINHDIEKTNKIIEQGFRMVKIHGNKRKKAIDEVEHEKLQQNIKKQNKALEKVKSDLHGYEKRLFDVVKTTRHYTLTKVIKLNFAWKDYKNTIYLYNEFTELYTNVSSRVENYDALYSDFMDDIEALEITQVKQRRDVRHKARYYIDEQGNKVNLDMTKEQAVIHK